MKNSQIHKPLQITRAAIEVFYSERAKVDGDGNLRVCVKQSCAFYRQDSKAAIEVFYGERAKVH